MKKTTAILAGLCLASVSVAFGNQPCASLYDYPMNREAYLGSITASAYQGTVNSVCSSTFESMDKAFFQGFSSSLPRD